MPRHVYTLADGTPIPSVSEIIAQTKAADVRGIDRACDEIESILRAEPGNTDAIRSRLWNVRNAARSGYQSKAIEEAAELGTLAHRLIERDCARDHIDPSEITESVAPMWVAWTGWRFERTPSIEHTPDGRLASELSLTTPIGAQCPYGGTIDLVVQAQGRRILVDVKTRPVLGDALPSAGRAALCQIGAYTYLWNTNFPAAKIDLGLVLILGRKAALFREEWVPQSALVASMSEFGALRMAWEANAIRKAVLKDTRRANKAGRAAIEVARELRAQHLTHHVEDRHRYGDSVSVSPPSPTLPAIDERSRDEDAGTGRQPVGAAIPNKRESA